MEYFILILAVLTGCTVSTIPSAGPHQSSMFNALDAKLALDGDITTCMETGFERGAWWANVMNKTINVTGVTIHGSATAIQVRVGSHMDYQGNLGNFGPNPLCHYSPNIKQGMPNVYSCESGGVVGNIISVQAVDPAYSEKLILCELTMHTGA